MLILTSDRVRRCQVKDSRSGAGGTMEAIVYRNTICVFVSRYTVDERKSALLAARDLLDADRFCLLLQGKKGFSLWELAPWAQPTDLAEPEAGQSLAEATAVESEREAVEVGEIDLIAAIVAMRRTEPPPIRDRYYRLRIYPQVFVGQEIVKWFVRQFNLPHAAAIRLGQRFLDEGLAHHVTDEHQFEDRFLFYRFFVDEEQTATASPNGNAAATPAIEVAAAPTAAEPALLKIENEEDIDIVQLALDMRDAQNLLGNRRYMLRIYPRSFVGHEAIDWLVEHLGVSRGQALRLGQRLLDAGLIRHVTEDHQFEDRYLFYEFLE